MNKLNQLPHYLLGFKLFKPTYLLAMAMLLNSSLSVCHAADKLINIKSVIKPVEKLEPPQQLLNAIKPIDINTQILELHGLGKTREVNTGVLELHGISPAAREINTASLELHGLVGAGNAASLAKEVNTATLALHGIKLGTKEVNVAGTLELHGKSKSTETSISQKRIGMSALPTMQGNAVQDATKIVPLSVTPIIAPKNNAVDPAIIKQNSAAEPHPDNKTPENKIAFNQAPTNINSSTTIASKSSEVKSVMPVVIQNIPPTNSFDKAAYKRGAESKLGNLWLGKCSNINCKRDMQKIIDARIAEVLDKADKSVDLRNPILVNNLENQMDTKYNPQMQQVLDTKSLDQDKPVIRSMPKPIKTLPNNLKL